MLVSLTEAHAITCHVSTSLAILLHKNVLRSVGVLGNRNVGVFKLNGHAYVPNNNMATPVELPLEPEELEDPSGSNPASKQPPWDPMSSQDWDMEKHNPFALVRIQR